MKPIREALQLFLSAQKATHNNPALLDLYSPAMEVQVNVAAGNGFPIEGRRNAYQDQNGNQWASFRIPHRADTEPTFQDYPIRWPLELHTQNIGLTGWNWQQRRSIWVGFDFDALTNHAKGVGIPDSELARIKDSVSNVPWVEVIRSTRGAGLHLRVYFEGSGVPCENHKLHAALARCVLGKLSTEVGFNLAANVDVCGAVLWIWSRNATKENRGLESIKTATAKLTESNLPNWKLHLDVVTRKRERVQIKGIDNQDIFDALAQVYPNAELDEKHREHINLMRELGFASDWINDHNCWNTHTAGLKKLHEKLGLTGVFDTLSAGNNPLEANCACFPRANGSWKVYRFPFGSGPAESPSWEKDLSGNTSCWLNRPSFETAARAYGGMARERGGYSFNSAKQAIATAAAIGIEIDLPERVSSREMILRISKDEKLVAEIEKRDNDQGLEGWDATAKRNHWVKIFGKVPPPEANDERKAKIVRHLISPSFEPISFPVLSAQGTWDHQTKANATAVLRSLNLSKDEAEKSIGEAIRNRWVKVSLPFQPEYPGGNKWNLDAPQYLYGASLIDAPHHPTWDALFAHLGKNLTEAVRKNQWCKENDIVTGPEWLLLWVVCLLRDPFCKLPYLFFWGPGNSGKSSFHESISLLVSKGVRDAKRALTNSEGFNDELDGTVLAYIDEYDLSESRAAAQRIKEWTTALTISIRRMRCNLYHVPSTLHFAHFANDPSYCRVLPGDVRKVITYVERPTVEIPKDQLQARLKAEAPDFMRTVLTAR